MKSEKILIVYSFLTCLFIMVVGIFSTQTTNQLLSSFIYLPLVFFFGTRIFEIIIHPRYFHTSSTKRRSRQASVNEDSEEDVEEATVKGVADSNKRLLLQLIGTTGISLLLMSLFSRKARDTFLGGGGQTGTVGIKDTTGKIIDPAEKHPTDGYSITDIDDAGIPSYYSFVKNDGAWYIMQNHSGTFRYVKGDGNYTASWDVRSKLHYDYYNKIFSS